MWKKARKGLSPPKLTMGSGTRVVSSGVSSESTAEMELRLPKLSHTRESSENAPIIRTLGFIIAHFKNNSTSTLMIEVLLVGFFDVAGRLSVFFGGRGSLDILHKELYPFN